MTQVWREWGPVILVSVAGLPLAGCLAFVLAGWRQRSGLASARAWARSAAEVGMVAGTLPWIWMILTPKPAAAHVSLVPLRDLAEQLAGEPAVAAVQIVANLLVFAALGFFAPIRFAALAGVVRLFMLGVAASGLVEMLQFVLDLGRVSSVDDVLLNAVGATVAGLTSRHWWRGGSSLGAQASP